MNYTEQTHEYNEHSSIIIQPDLQLQRVFFPPQHSKIPTFRHATTCGRFVDILLIHTGTSVHQFLYYATYSKDERYSSLLDRWQMLSSYLCLSFCVYDVHAKFMNV